MTRWTRRSRTARPNVLWRSSSSSSRPTNGTDTVTRRPTSSDTDTARQASTPAAKPRADCDPSRSVTTVSRARLRTTGPSSTSPGSAACCSRAAALTARPVANVDSVSSATISPDSIADSHLEAELVHGLDDRERGPHRPLGVVLVCDRHAERRHHGVAGELLDGAAVRNEAVGDEVEEPRHARAHDLRVGCRDELGRADEVREEHRCQLALHPHRIGVARHSRPTVPACRRERRSLRWSACSTRRSSRRTTFAASTARSSTRRARTRSGAPTSSTSSRARSPSAGTCACLAPAMAAAVIEGAADGGADVVDLGMVGTEMVYYAVGALGLEGGICVTASHNPKQYTGMKIVRRGALPVGRRLRPRRRAGGAPRRASGRWRAAARSGRRTCTPASSTRCSRSSTSAAIRAAAHRRRRRERHGRARCCRRCWSGCRSSTSCAATSSPTARSRTTSRTRCCPRTATSSSRRPREEGADLGVAYDGDADRCFFVDDTGEFVPGDFVTALLAESDARRGARAARCSTTCGRAGPCRARSRRPAGRRSSTASATRSSSTACARRTPSSRARCRRTTTSATSPRPTPASCRSCSCWS